MKFSLFLPSFTAMLSYNQLIEGYESPQQSDEENKLIDYCNATASHRTMHSYVHPEPLPVRPPAPKARKERLRSKVSQKPFTMSNKRDFMLQSGKKAYTFLNDEEMDEFQDDLKKGELSKEELCQKYKVSISTTARFIRNLKEYGQLNVKKSRLACNQLMNKLILEYPNLTFAQIKKKMGQMAQSMSSQKQYELASTSGAKLK